MIVLARDETVPRREELQRALVSVWATHTDRRVHDVDARIEIRLQIGLGEAVWILEPICLLVEVERQQVEHGDHRRAPDQIDSLPRILGSGTREQTESPAIDH